MKRGSGFAPARKQVCYHAAVKYECDKCGACCKHLIVEADDIDLMREPQLLYADRDFVANYGPDEAVEALQEDVGRCLIIACGKPCYFLEENQCSIYSTRPNACVAMQAGDEQCQQARREEGIAPLLTK